MNLGVFTEKREEAKGTKWIVVRLMEQEVGELLGFFFDPLEVLRGPKGGIGQDLVYKLLKGASVHVLLLTYIGRK